MKVNVFLSALLLSNSFAVSSSGEESSNNSSLNSSFSSSHSNNELNYQDDVNLELDNILRESVFVCIGLKSSFKRKTTSCNSIKKEKLEDVLQNPQNFEKIISNLEEIKALKDTLNESEKICFSLDKNFNIVCFGSFKEELSAMNVVHSINIYETQEVQAFLELTTSMNTEFVMKKEI